MRRYVVGGYKRIDMINEFETIEKEFERVVGQSACSIGFDSTDYHCDTTFDSHEEADKARDALRRAGFFSTFIHEYEDDESQESAA